MGILTPRKRAPQKVYPNMPTQAELEADMTQEAAQGIMREYVLPQGDFNIDGEFDIPEGSTLRGMGRRSNATRIVLTADGQIRLHLYSRLEGLHILQNGSATVPAVYALTQNDGDGNYLTLRDLMLSGGTAGIWTMHLRNTTEVYGENIKIETAGNGVLLDMDAVHTTNPGDSEFVNLFVKCTSNNATCLKIASPETSGAPFVNNLAFFGGSLTTDGVATGTTGIEIINAKRLNFFKINAEQQAYAVTMDGQVGSGAETKAVSFFGGKLGNGDFEVNSGVLSAALFGTETDVTFTGTNLDKLHRVAQLDTASGVTEMFTSTALRQLGDTPLLRAGEVVLSNATGSTIGANRCAKIATGFGAGPFNNGDTANEFAGVTRNSAAAGEDLYVTTAGVVPIQRVSGSSISVGDYVKISSTAGEIESAGVSPASGTIVLGVAWESSAESAPLVLLRPHVIP